MNLRDIMMAKTISSGGTGGVTVQADWQQNNSYASDYIKNKPFYEKSVAPITWDGKTEGLTYSNGFYKISNSVFTNEQMLGTAYTYTEYDTTQYMSYVLNKVFATDDIFASPHIVVVRKSGASDNSGRVYPEMGLYLLKGSVGGKSQWVSNVVIPPEIKTIDEQFIPDAIARKSEVTWSNLPDAPFGEVLHELWPETSLKVTSWADQLHFTAPASLELGKTYRFIFEGVEYTRTAFSFDNGICIGNRSLYSSSYENTAEPFLLKYYNAYSEKPWTLHVADTGTYKCALYGFTAKPIDEKYIPDTIARLDDIPTEASEYEFVEFLNDISIVEPLASASGEIYTTNNDELYIL